MTENKVIIPPDFFIREVRPTIRRLEDLIEFRGYETVELDFSGVYACFPDAMLPFLSRILKYKEDGVTFILTPPILHKLNRTFDSSNWNHIIDHQNFLPSSDDRIGRFPTRIFKNSKEQNEITNDIIDRILRITTFLDRNHLRALEWSLFEITDNVLTHSFSDLGGLIQLTVKSNAKEIEFVVTDCGIGIPESLRQGLKTKWTDERAIEEAVKEGVTRGSGQGNGLFGSFQIAMESKGAFSINSGRAFLTLSRDGRTKVQSNDDPWPGTSVDCSINFSSPLSLERALKFGDTTHVPLDIIDLSYQNISDDPVFILKNEAESVGSRPSGFEARRKLENIIRLSGANKFYVDCQNIGIMSSSFADEFFAKLIVSLGREFFFEKILIVNLNAVNTSIINRSVGQRMKDSTSIDLALMK